MELNPEFGRGKKADLNFCINKITDNHDSMTETGGRVNSLTPLEEVIDRTDDGRSTQRQDLGPGLTETGWGVNILTPLEKVIDKTDDDRSTERQYIEPKVCNNSSIEKGFRSFAARRPTTSKPIAVVAPTRQTSTPQKICTRTVADEQSATAAAEEEVDPTKILLEKLVKAAERKCEADLQIAIAAEKQVEAAKRMEQFLISISSLIQNQSASPQN